MALLPWSSSFTVLLWACFCVPAVTVLPLALLLALLLCLGPCGLCVAAVVSEPGPPISWLLYADHMCSEDALSGLAGLCDCVVLGLYAREEACLPTGASMGMGSPLWW